MKKQALLCLILLVGTTLALCQENNQIQKNLVWDTIQYPKSVYGWELGQQVPNVSIQDVNGYSFDLYDLLDKPLLIDFWFIACKPCVANKKYLRRFYRQYDLNLMSISVDRRASTVKQYAEQNDMPWYNVHDDNGYANRFKVQIGSNQTYPLYLIIGPDKRIAGVFHSGSQIGQLGVLLQELFQE